GRYMAAAARVEWAGVPIDTGTLGRLRSGWEGIKGGLIATVDEAYGVYENGSVREGGLRASPAREGAPPPPAARGRAGAGRAALPQVAPLRELRHSLSQLRLNDLAVGPDGRNRVLLSAFASRTGRNQPSNSRFIFGPSAWLRGLIKPGPGAAVAYVDWEQQEF